MFACVSGVRFEKIRPCFIAGFQHLCEHAVRTCARRRTTFAPPPHHRHWRHARVAHPLQTALCHNDFSYSIDTVAFFFLHIVHTCCRFFFHFAINSPSINWRPVLYIHICVRCTHLLYKTTVSHPLLFAQLNDSSSLAPCTVYITCYTVLYIYVRYTRIL